MVSRIFFALIGLLFMGLVYTQVKKKRFSGKESFFLATLFLAFIVFRLTGQVSILQERVKELAQDHAILEERVKLIEQQRDPQEASS